MFESKKEMAQAMLDGKVIEFAKDEFADDAIAYWDEDVNSSPFRYKKRDVGSTANLAGAWDRYKEVAVQKEWWENCSEEKPRLCWVSNLGAKNKSAVCFIVARPARLFITDMDGEWTYATPVKPEELGE